MLPDSTTNFLYLTDTLPVKHSVFFSRFKALLDECKIAHELLPGTKDIWAVDYMPIQIEKDTFIQFTYFPDYLRGKKWSKTISDVDSICKSINISPEKSTIVVDGGNVIQTTDKVIMCDKVFKENPTINKKELIRKLENLFMVEKIIFIPTQPDDYTGHADGMVRFFDRDTVLINDYSKEMTELQMKFRKVLSNEGLKIIEIPYNPYHNKSDDHANGIYINFLEMEAAILVPVFGLKEDEITIKLFEDLYKGRIVRSINSNEIADEGGVLNCISWNILQ